MEYLEYTHRKVSWHATCLVWMPGNTEEVLEFLNDGTTKAELHDPEHIIIRYGDNRENLSIDTITLGSVIARGENYIKKCFDSEIFKKKYEALCVPVPIQLVDTADSIVSNF